MARLPWKRLKTKNRNRIEKETQLGFDVESLESRKMLAGNVDVIVSGDNLIIRGDSADNEIVVGVVAGHIEVGGTAGTTVTGGTTNLAVADLNKLTITMKGGNDGVVVNPNVTPQGRVRITGSAGDDGLIFLGTAWDQLQMIGGSGNDLIASAGTVAGTTVFNGGGGNDSFVVGGTYNDKFTLKGGGGNDIAGVTNATFTSDVRASMGGGVDAMNVAAGVSFGLNTRLAFGGGDDLFVVTTTPTAPVGAEVLILGGAGMDTCVPDAATLNAIPGVTVKSFELTV